MVWNCFSVRETGNRKIAATAVVVGEIKLATCLERPMIGSDGWLTLDIYLCIYIRIHIYMYACVYVLCV